MYLITLLFTVFIDSLGFGLVFPIFSHLLINNEGGMFSPESSLALRGMVFGLLVSTFCLGQFFGGPFLGALSDRRGRKRVLIASMWLAFIGYVIASLGIVFQSLFMLFLARILSGVAAGSYAVAQSVIADISKEENKAKNFGLIGMAWGTGFIIGPYIGGKLAEYGYEAPFICAALFCACSALFLLRFKESLQKIVSCKISLRSLWGYGIGQIRLAWSIPNLRGIFIVMFIFSLGWGFFTEFSPVFLIRFFNFSISQIANFYAWVGLWIAICQGILIRPLLKKFSPYYLLPSALLSLGFILPLILFLKGMFGLLFLLPCIAFFEALIFPTAATIVSNASSNQTQGEMLGFYNSIQYAAIGISPLFSGSLVALCPSLPITVGSASMGIAFFVFLWAFKRKKIPLEEESSPEE